MSYLYRYEAKGLQSFILQTNRLREMKGGSALIEKLGSSSATGSCSLLETVINSMPEGERPKILSCAAGGANLEFPTKTALDSFASVWPMLVEQFAPGLQVIQAWVVLEKGGQLSGASWQTLQKKLRSKRNQLNVSLPEAGPSIFRAPRTGLPAHCLNKRGDDGQERQDKGTYKRFLAGESKQDIVGEKIDQDTTWATDLAKHLRGDSIAVIHIDGNDLGNRIKDIQKADGDIGEALRRFSDALSKVTLEAGKAGFKAAKKAWEDGGASSDVFPGCPIVLGGDDITFILRADLAFAFTCACLKAFEEESKNSDVFKKKVTACAGIAFTSMTFPFDMGHELAEHLCKFAKNNLRKKDNDSLTASGVAFHRVTTSMITDYESILKTELSSTEEDGYLTAGPYTLEEIDSFLTIGQLFQLSSCLARLPSGSVRETISLLNEDRTTALEKWERIEEVLVGQDEQTETKGSENIWAELRALGDWKEKTVLGLDVGDRSECSPLLDAWVLSRVCPQGRPSKAGEK